MTLQHKNKSAIVCQKIVKFKIESGFGSEYDPIPYVNTTFQN